MDSGFNENWLDGQAQRVVLNSADPSWRSVANGVPRGQYGVHCYSTYQ